MDKHTERITRDKALIEELGGPAKLADRLGYDKDGGVQRVQNWTTRGIPAAVKVTRPDLFMKDAIKRAAKRPIKPTTKAPEEAAEAGQGA